MILGGPETGERKRVTRKAGGKLTLLVNLVVSWHEKLRLLVTPFSVPMFAYPFQGHPENMRSASRPALAGPARGRGEPSGPPRRSPPFAPSGRRPAAPRFEHRITAGSPSPKGGSEKGDPTKKHVEIMFESRKRDIIPFSGSPLGGR